MYINLRLEQGTIKFTNFYYKKNSFEQDINNNIMTIYILTRELSLENSTDGKAGLELILGV